MKPDKPGIYWIKYRDPYLDGTQGQQEIQVVVAAFGNNSDDPNDQSVDDWVMFIGDEVPHESEHVLEIGLEITVPPEWCEEV
jgi:hypothetical protein